MTDLTEQWKKGELPAGEYYIRYPFGETTTGVFDGKYWEFLFDNDEARDVLALVPSYEEWQAKDDALTALLAEYGKLTKELQDEKEKHMTRFSLLSPADEVVMLEAENAKLKTENKKLCKKIDELYENIDMWAEELAKAEKENAKLKETVELIKKGLQETIEGYRMTPIARAEFLLKELNEVLK